MIHNHTLGGRAERRQKASICVEVTSAGGAETQVRCESARCHKSAHATVVCPRAARWEL